MRIAVVGGGVIGVTIAHALLDGGHAVTIIDREGFGAQASGRNAGWIAHADILPLAGPKAWRNLPRWLCDPLGPLTIRPAYLPAILPWMLRFVAASSPQRIEASTHAIAALNGAALPAWKRRLAALDLTDALVERGQVSVWSDASAFAQFPALAKRQRDLGVPVQTLTAPEVAELEPAFGRAVASGWIQGGAHYPTVPHVTDPADLTERLGQRAVARGAEVVTGAVQSFAARGDGVSVRFANGTELAADRAVLALGAWSKPLAATAGDRVPLDTERGYNVTTTAGTLGLSRPVMYEGHGFVTSPLACGDRIGGAVEFAGLDADPNYARVDALLGKLRRFLPDLGAVEGVRRLCFRPSIPDSLPVIGTASAIPQVIHAFGHGHYGLTQAAITAELVAAQIDRRAPPLPLDAFSPQRF
ncbi:NAD(P)/FAD-dependent oxidoreductase [Azospirillum griseum]|uniref:FAD-binding oxidoreductase n=1 Tax=Azospirillum griseum TaxID=2496639 RepID=A0A431VC24_9PROT|nr:FAD-dependent oxidoreductase [Azospirillum griseum]RTR16138.1 FAD-binding oxidoreductase [Azospirillum griseum]